MVYVYESQDYDFSYQGYKPLQRALSRKGIRASVGCVPKFGDGVREMRVEVPLGTQMDTVNSVVTRIQKRYPVRQERFEHRLK